MITGKYVEIRDISKFEELRSKWPEFFVGLDRDESERLVRSISEIDDVPEREMEELRAAYEQLEYERNDMEDKLDDAEKDRKRDSDLIDELREKVKELESKIP